MEIISFIIGGLFTLIILLTGSFIGYIIGSKKLDEKVKEIQHKSNSSTPLSGSVKAISPEEIKKEGQKGFINKMKEIIQ